LEDFTAVILKIKIFSNVRQCPLVNLPLDKVKHSRKNGSQALRFSKITLFRAVSYVHVHSRFSTMTLFRAVSYVLADPSF
jgi:hypothetical protein